MVTMRRSLRPAGVTRVHLEPASLERGELVHLVQLVHLDAELLRQVEVVRRQLVLGVVATPDVAVAAGDAAGAARPDAAEVRVVGLDARAAEVDAHRGLVERLASPDLGRDLLQDPIDVGGHVRVANDPEHPGRLVEVRRELVGPIGDAGPFRRVEELLRRDVQRVGIDMRTAAHARAGEDQHVVEVLDPLDPVELRRREPQEVGQVPLGLRDVLVLPAPAGLHDADAVALLRGTERGDASTEARADDQYVVIEARHGVHGRDSRDCSRPWRPGFGPRVDPVEHPASPGLPREGSAFRRTRALGRRTRVAPRAATGASGAPWDTVSHACSTGRDE